MVPLIAAGVAIFAGGVAVGKALGDNSEKEGAVREMTVRRVSEEDVPAHIRKKIVDKARNLY